MSKNLKLRNPYVAGKALGQDKAFVGRQDVIQLVEDELFSPDRNAVVIFGQRRIGKTSILLQLRRRLAPSLFLPVYFDLMDRAHQPMGQVLHEMAAAISAEIGMPVPDAQLFDDEGVYFRREFLPALNAKLPEDRRPILLLDEFDVLDPETERQLPQSAAGRTFWSYVRRLMEGESRLGFVFVMGRKADELSADVKAAFKAARYKKVSFLDDKHARELIGTAAAEGTLQFTDAAVNRILQLTSGHPYFTQLVCQLVWDEAWSRNPSSTPRADVAHVESMVTKAPEAGETICEWIWEGLPPAEKVIFSAVAQATETAQAVSTPELIELLQRHGIRILTRELEIAPDTLVKWEMLEEKDGKYRYIIELMRRWVASRKPLSKVKDELDRMVPLADTLYQSGDGFYRRGNLESAQTLLRQALTVNPNHLKARLLAGQVLVEQGKSEEAVRELEEALRHDESAARYPLVRTLILRGEELQSAGDEEKALAAYERVLQLSPADKVATERRTAIWMGRGERAFKQDKLDEAEAAYKTIGAEAKLGDVEARRRKLHIDQLVETAKKSAKAEQWAKAIECYQELSTLEPQAKTWKDSLESAQVEQKFAKSYADALAAVQANDSRKAQRMLLEILNARPDYKDASKLLVQILRPDEVAVSKPVEVEPRRPFVLDFAIFYAKLLVIVLVSLFTGLLPAQPGAAFYAGVAGKLALLALLVEGGWYLVRRKDEGAATESLGSLSASMAPPKVAAAASGKK
ncbi:MAG: tetratricopeptide repeat protein [Bryobacteraceae bacterium]|nr:tetratricopeptide repeat protein [Bryobacteraceae bacterium]